MSVQTEPFENKSTQIVVRYKESFKNEVKALRDLIYQVTINICCNKN